MQKLKMQIKTRLFIIKDKDPFKGGIHFKHFQVPAKTALIWEVNTNVWLIVYISDT